MSWVFLLLGISVVVQLAATILALRLNLVYGQRLAWNCISLALLIMLVRRGFTLWGAMTGELWALAGADEESSISLAAASSTLAASLLMLLGVGLIGPMIRASARVEEVLRGEIDRLDRVVDLDQAELRLAAEIQQDMLPAAPPSLSGFDIAGFSRPAKTVGADYFDFIPLPNRELLIAVGDVSGHGVGPALLMAETRAFLRATAQHATDLGVILTRTHRFLRHNQPGHRFVTLFLIRLAADSENVYYASAGHPAYLLRARGGVETLAATGLPLGVPHENIIDADCTTMHPDDVLLIATDGVHESRRADDGMFGSRRTLASVHSHREGSAQTIIDGLFRAALRFSNGELQQDDMTVVVVKRCNSRDE